MALGGSRAFALFSAATPNEAGHQRLPKPSADKLCRQAYHVMAAACAVEASSLHLLRHLGITHVLNATEVGCCWRAACCLWESGLPRRLLLHTSRQCLSYHLVTIACPPFWIFAPQPASGPAAAGGGAGVCDAPRAAA